MQESSGCDGRGSLPSNSMDRTDLPKGSTSVWVQNPRSFFIKNVFLVSIYLNPGRPDCAGQCPGSSGPARGREQLLHQAALLQFQGFSQGFELLKGLVPGLEAIGNLALFGKRGYPDG